MGGLDDTSARVDESDGARAMQPGAEYRVPHDARFEAPEPDEGARETSSYEAGGYKGRDLHEFRSAHEGEFLEPLSRSTPVEKFQDPDKLVRAINPEYVPIPPPSPYNVNCADCARSVERTWRGNHEEAAGRAWQIDESGFVEPYGESSEETEEWAGEQFLPAHDPETLRARLEQGGHGSSAIVHTQYSFDGDRLGHAYNVVNHHGDLRVLDGQSGQTRPWTTGEIFPLGTDQTHRAMAWNGKGERIW